MVVFRSLSAALEAGFHWVEYRPEENLHLVELDRLRSDGMRERALAYAYVDMAA